MDQLWPVVVGGLIAVVGGVAGSLITASIQSRRDHSRWLREKRYDAFAAVVTYQVESMRLDAAIARADASGGDPQRRLADLEALNAELAAHERSLAAANVPLTLLGPGHVMKIANDFIAANVADDRERAGSLFSKLTTEMQRALQADGR